MDPLSSFTTLLEGKVTTKMSDCFIYRGNFSAFTFGNVSDGFLFEKRLEVRTHF